ncbi:DHHW family protein [Exiguobacterium flavidum]|uniref:DHHW family protein n=1 Tax=Exiguobacterium flavidum TaxID=2184695 RepID=UPI000DF84528|nr:DHHW family protein [Exiguobacterium flavidum]
MQRIVRPGQNEERKSLPVKRKFNFEDWMMRLTIASFLIVLLAVGTWTIIKEDRVASQLENRKLATLQSPTVDSVVSGEYAQSFEKYFTDQLALRGTLVEAQALVAREFLRQPFRNGIYTARNGYMIEPADTKTRPVPEAFKKFASDVGVPVYFALAPSKTVIAEKQGILPSYVASNATERHDAMIDQVEAKGIESISLDDLRIENYFKTDHHWNIDGAYIAYAEITGALKQKFPEIELSEMNPADKKRSGESYYGSLARKTTLAYVQSADTIEYYGPEQFKGLDVCYDGKCGNKVIDESFMRKKGDYVDRYEAFLNGNHGLMSISSKEDGPRILVVKDSFANPVLPFLARSMDIEVVDIRYTKKSFDVSDYAKEKQVDAVLFLHNSNISGMMPMYERTL